MEALTQTLKLIEELDAPEATKSALAKEVETQGVTPELIQKISELIDRSEKEFLTKSETDMRNFQLSLEDSKKELEGIKRGKKLASKANDEKALEQIRKQLQ